MPIVNRELTTENRQQPTNLNVSLSNPIKNYENINRNFAHRF